jgi:hypothetical protein
VKALSIRQPWPWFILADFSWAKLFENRDWAEPYLRAQLGLVPIGSDFLIHASKGVTKAEFQSACLFAKRAGATRFPDFLNLKRGGIVGMARLAGVVRQSSNPWFTGPLALALEKVYPTPFRPCKGALGFFEPDFNTRDETPDLLPVE